MSEQIEVSVTELEESKDHVFTVEFNGELWTAVYPAPLAELCHLCESEKAAWHGLISDRVKQKYGGRWPIDNPQRAASQLWSMLKDIPIDAEDCIEVEFLHFERGTDKYTIHHWFEEYFNLSIATDL